MHAPAPPSTARAVFALLVASSIIGLAGTDLVLPAVPTLPDVLDGTLAQAQLVLAAFAAGTAVGFLAFGELGARFDQRALLIGSLLAYGALSLLAAAAERIDALIAIRVVQGFTASAAAVYAPGMIRRLYDEQHALQALGVMGSMESLAPALAPVFGYWLLITFDWRASFVLIAVVALLVALAWALLGKGAPDGRAPRGAAGGGYLLLLGEAPFMRYAVSQACTLGGLLVFVFGAPAVITRTMDGSLEDFVIMQVVGITLFIVATNLSGRTVARFGIEPVILFGSLLSTLGLVATLAYALTGGRDPAAVVVTFAFVNLGLGLRGPPGFYRAVQAARDDDARGAALTMLFVLMTTAAGTAAVAPVIEAGLLPLAAVATGISLVSVLLLLWLPGGLDPRAADLP